MQISKVIKQHNKTIQEVADAIGVSRPTLAATIGNNPTVKTLRNIAQVLDCNISDFFEDEYKGSTESDIIVNGFLEINGKIHKITSVEELKKLTSTL